MIPGANVLSMAARVLRLDTLQHRAFVSRTPNDAGDYENTYAAAVDIKGSLQPVDKKLYQELGLDLAKNYATLYTSADVKSTQRDQNGDVILGLGATWLCESDRDWRAVDGWRKTLCVEIPAAQVTP